MSMPAKPVMLFSLTYSANISAYRGKDSRYAKEQNVGLTTAGEQASGWFYSQTNCLRQLGDDLWWRFTIFVAAGY